MGSLQGTAFEVAGSLGPLEALLEGGSVEQQLAGRLGDVDLSLRGAIGDLATLADPDVELEISGPDVATVTRTLDLPALGMGPFRVSGGVSPTEPGGPLDLRLEAAVGEVEVQAEGRVSSLADPRDLQLSIDARGPDPSALGLLDGIDRVPAAPFAVSGNIRLSDGEATFERFSARLGDHRLSLHGVLSSAPEWSGSEVEIDAEGRDLSAFDALAGVDLPARSYEVRGRLSRREEEIAADDFEVRIGTTRARLEGTLGRLPSFAGAELDLRVLSRRPADFAALAGVPLPSQPVEIEGHLGYWPDRVELESVVLTAAESELRLAGVVRAVPGFSGSDLRIRAAGNDLARAAALVPAELPELPAQRYEISGHVRALGAEGYELDGIEGSLGDTRLRLEGRLGADADLAGTLVRFQVAGADLSLAGRIAGLAGLPVEPYEVQGRLGVESDGYALEGVVARAGDIELRAAGRLGPLPQLDGTDLEVEARGPRVSDLATYRELPPLPADPFAAAGRVRIEGGIYHLEEVVGELGSQRATASGTVGPFPELGATDLALTFAGPDAGTAGRLLLKAGLDWVPELPPDPYTLSGGLRVVESDYRLSGVAFTLGAIQGHAEAKLDSFARAAGMELTADARGPDASVVGAVAGLQVPAQAWSARGRVDFRGTEVRFHEVRAELGDHRVEVDGTLGKPPRLIGTELDVRAEGPGTSVASELLGRPASRPLPDQPYQLAAHLEGSPEDFLVEELRARFGPSDLEGSLHIDLREKPDVRLALRSERLDLPTLLGLEELPAAGTWDAEVAGRMEEKPLGNEPALLIGDDPFGFDALDALNAEVRYLVTRVTARAGTFHDVEVSADLRDGRLHIERSSIAGENTGSLSLGLTLEPAEDGYRLLGRMTGADIRSPGFTPDRNLELAVPLDFDLLIDGSGGSPHALASGLDGHLIVALGAGQIDLTLFKLVAARLPVLSNLFRLIGSFNLLAQTTDYTPLECSVTVARIEDGVVELQPVATRVQYLDILGTGRVDLETEELDFRWATKPRGLKLGVASMADGFMKIGGTLAAPEVETQPLDAVAKTGLAVGTAGISLAAGGLWKRMTADRKLCKKALAEARKALAAERAGG